MITAGQMRAARVLLGIDQRRLAELSGLSVPTIQRMEASDTIARQCQFTDETDHRDRGAGIELIGEGANSAAEDAACG